ncbi:jg6362 [Pararge aegeria aegeria]|uniref:Jg6362 protein n=1 Tax=Pararge aegeria aegeria TaxID=348720 RepID=A0A8S4RTC3_9NEOP|nr:jg6362 [Pararge aegeria aegeria]
MLGIISFSLLFISFQAVTSQIPEHCRRPPPGVTPSDCCKIPKVFTKEDLEECGVEDRETKKSRGPQDCSKHVCLLKRYNLMKDDETVDRAAIGDFLDKYRTEHIQFEDAIAKAKKKCLEGDLPGPPHICEPTKLGLCIMVVTFQECPVMEDSENCKKLKDHMDECKQYYQS